MFVSFIATSQDNECFVQFVLSHFSVLSNIYNTLNVAPV